MIKLKPILRGVLSYTPLLKILKRGVGSKGTGGTNSARYCYSVWLRHLIHLNKSGLKNFPRVIAELGPGDSLGIGLAALLTGTDKYFAFDIIEHSNVEANLTIFDELLNLFKSKTKIPGTDEFPSIKPALEALTFPAHILNTELMRENLQEKRIDDIKKAITSGKSGNIQITYKVPWQEIKNDDLGSVDLIISQAVMEHVADLEYTYAQMFKWLKKGGYISHQIDYSAHETADTWDGHWRYNKLVWQIIMHGRSYLINRMPHSFHLNLIQNSGFTIVNEVNVNQKSNLIKVADSLSKYFSKHDPAIKSALIQAVK